MHRLNDVAPDVAVQFQQGTLIALSRTSKTFSAIPIDLDQADEQNIALVKREGGAVGLTENPSALRR